MRANFSFDIIKKIKTQFKYPFLLYKLPFFTQTISCCPICGGQGQPESKNMLTELDRCIVCNHVYSRKLPKNHILSLFYGDFDYWAKDKAHQGIKEIDYSSKWDGFIQARMKILLKTGVFTNGQQCRIYEVGCSEGMLLKVLMNQGHEVSGCEMNRAIAEEGKKRLGVDITSAKFEDLVVPYSSFDLVMSFHTMEHICNPVQVLKKVTSMLKPNGTFLVEVPIGEEEYSNTDHLHFFSETSLNRLLGQFFEKVRLIDNSYQNPKRIYIKSLYAIASQVK